jgi:hypothetical protein
VTWTEQGIEVKAAALSGLPIEDGSICWGAWLEADGDEAPARGHTDSRQGVGMRQKMSPHQLVLSPLPPDTWPVSFCIQLALKDHRYGPAYATRAIHALGLNIISAKTAPSGFSHTTWTLVCEAPELRRKVFHHTRSLRHCLSPSRTILMDMELVGPELEVFITASESQSIAITDGVRVIDLEEDQKATVEDALRSACRELRALSSLDWRPLHLNDDQVEICQRGKPESPRIKLTRGQLAELLLPPRAKPLSKNTQDRIWSNFAATVAQRLLIRMHEALWCLRLVSHLEDAIVRQFDGDHDKILERIERIVRDWRDKHEHLHALVEALKFVIDEVSEDPQLVAEPRRDDGGQLRSGATNRDEELRNGLTKLAERFEQTFRSGNDLPTGAARRTTKKDFEAAINALELKAFERNGESSSAAGCLYYRFVQPNRTGFLHHRFLYGLDGFLIGDPQGTDPFEAFTRRHPIEDGEGEGGQSLQRILNGIRGDAAESIRPYDSMITDLVDRSNEWSGFAKRQEQARLEPDQRQKLVFLLNIDARRRTAKAADGRLLTHLLYLWVRIHGDLVRVREFRYERERQLLRASGRGLAETIPNAHDLTLPLRSVISVNPLQCVAKFFPVIDEHRERLLRVRVEYEVRFRQQRLPGNELIPAHREIKNSGGILDIVTSAIMRTGAWMADHTNHIQDRPRHLDSTERPRDRGAITLDVFMPNEYPRSLVANFIEQLETAVRKGFDEAIEADRRARAEAEHGAPLDYREVRLVSVKAFPNWLTRVFISTRFDNEFWRLHKTPIVEICKRAGFEPVFVEDPESITGTVMERIRGAHCFLQIIPLLQVDGDINSVNLGWLHGEYMAALMRGIPAVRAVQLDRNAKEQDWLKVLRVNSDHAFDTFASTTDLLQRTLPKMLDYLRKLPTLAGGGLDCMTNIVSDRRDSRVHRGNGSASH